MTEAHKTIGALVEFKDKVYRPPWSPYYDSYKGRVFEVDGLGPLNHVWIKDVNDHSFRIMIHDDEIRTVKKKE